MPNYLVEWEAISARIKGLIEACEMFTRLCEIQSSDPGAVHNILLPHANRIFAEVVSYRSIFTSILPIQVCSAIDSFVSTFNKYFCAETFHHGADPMAPLKIPLPALASLNAEINYLLRDRQIIITRITERAFVHLQRSIMADDDIRVKWQASFKKETACEKLGALHLLQFGIWAFKAHSPGERTDLIMGEPIDQSQIERTAEALVLTEWKLVRPYDDYKEKSEQVFSQAKSYTQGSLAGFELANYRYLVLVSEKHIDMPKDRIEGKTIYRFINIPVEPDPPSKR